MSDIEKDIKILEDWLKVLDDFFEKTRINNTKERNALRNALAERKQDKARIQELEEALLKVKDKNTTLFITCRNSIPKQKVKDLLTEIQEEYNKVQEQFDCIWNKKNKDDYERYKLQELSAMQQQLGFFIGKLEELLEDK